MLDTGQGPRGLLEALLGSLPSSLQLQGAACILGAMAWANCSSHLQLCGDQCLRGPTCLRASVLLQAGLCAEEVVRGLTSAEKDPGH